MAETFTVEQRGIGKPDYTKEIALGQIRPGIVLKYNQTLKIGGITFSNIPSPFISWVTTPLASGDTSHLIDWDTGLDTPFVVPAGYLFTIFQTSMSMNQDFNARIYYDTLYMGNWPTSGGGIPFWKSDIAKISTEIFDPTALSAHLVDIILENLGGDDMQGSYTAYCIMEAVGTPPLPKEKTIRCKWCGHKWIVPKETTSIKCPKCGELNIYFDISRVRRIGS